MGACATKPKVAKGGDLAPVLRPEPVKEAAEVSAVVKSENVHPPILNEQKTADKAKEIVDHHDNKIGDDQSTKRRSLSNLLKENEKAELAESEVNQEKEESTEQNPITEERSVTPILEEKVKQSEPVELAKLEQLENHTHEPLKGKEQSIAEKSVVLPEKQEENPVQNIEEKQQNIVTDEKPEETQKYVHSTKEKQLNVVPYEKPAETQKPVQNTEENQENIVTDEKPAETQESLQNTKEKQQDIALADEQAVETQESVQNTEEKQQEKVTDKKPAETPVTILTENSLDPEEKEVTIVEEKTLEAIKKQGSNATEFETPTAGLDDADAAATAFEKVIETTLAIEIKTGQPEKEERTEEAK